MTLWTGSSGSLNLLSALYAHAAQTPMRPSLLFIKDRTYRQFSYEDVVRETERWASLYRANGVATGDVVAIVLDHRYEAYPAFLGAMRAGAIPTFLAYPTPKQQPEVYWGAQAELFARVRPAIVVSYGSVLESLRSLTSGSGAVLLDVDALPAAPLNLPPLAEVERPDNVALLQHSSGTTGAKKGVQLTFAAIRAQNEAHAKALGATSSDRVLSWLPLYHDMGLIAAFLFPVALGGCIIAFDPFEWLLRPALFFELIERYRATLCWLPNFAFNHLVRTHDPERTYDLSSMRAFVNCSEPCKPATFDAFLNAFAPSGVTPSMLRTSYAMAEAVFAVTLSEGGRPPLRLAVDALALRTRRAAIVPVEEAIELLSCGRALGGVSIRIDATDGANVGEIAIRGDFVFPGYHRNPESTNASFDERWFRTGDIGFLYQGELYVCGRRKEMLVVHGQNFYANDIEEAASDVPGVKPGRVTAFGVFDEMVGSEEAVVLAESEFEEDEERADLARRIRSDVFSKLGLQVRTVEILPVGDLIKTTSGKMSRGENARRFHAAMRPAV